MWMRYPAVVWQTREQTRAFHGGDVQSRRAGLVSPIRVSLAKGDPHELILGVTALPGAAELGRAGIHNVIYLNVLDRGNHFAAWKEPDFFTTEISAAFTSLR
jgi:hypothetical protein